MNFRLKKLTNKASLLADWFVQLRNELIEFITVEDDAQPDDGV